MRWRFVCLVDEGNGCMPRQEAAVLACSATHKLFSVVLNIYNKKISLTLSTDTIKEGKHKAHPCLDTLFFFWVFSCRLLASFFFLFLIVSSWLSAVF